METEVLQAAINFCDVAEFIGREALAPILTGLTVSVAFWFGQSWSASKQNVDSHDLRTRHMSESLARQSRDLNRNVTRLKIAFNTRKLAVIHANESMMSSGTLGLMSRQALDEALQSLRDQGEASLHQIRDEVNRRAEEYQFLCRQEGYWEQRRRRKRDRPLPPLRLDKEAREFLIKLRHMKVNDPDRGRISVISIDPSAGEKWVGMLMGDEGITPAKALAE